jgi:hypothetical protein
MNPFLEEDLCYEEKCPICLDNDSFTRKSWVKLHCLHLFHRHCIKIWMEKKDTCPVCVQSIRNNDNKDNKDIQNIQNIQIDINDEEDEEDEEERRRINREKRCTRMLKISFTGSAIGLFVSCSVAYFFTPLDI